MIHTQKTRFGGMRAAALTILAIAGVLLAGAPPCRRTTPTRSWCISRTLGR